MKFFVSGNKYVCNPTFIVLLSLTLSLLLAVSLGAAEAPFYQGKTVRIIVPFSTGGNNDATARLIARSMSNHIEGNPTILVQNMPGAGGTVATNFACNVAKPDGLTFLSAHAPVVLSQLLGVEGSECNFGRFEYLGSLKGELLVFVVRTDLPYKSADDLKKATRRITIGGTGPTNLSTLAGRILAAGGYNVNVTTGYAGHGEIYRALMTGEAGAAVVSGLHARKEADNLRPLFWVSSDPPYWANLPHLSELPLPSDIRYFAKLATVPDDIGRAYVAPPRTPPERVEVLRQALEKTVKSPEFKAQTEKMQIETHWRDAKETQSMLQQVLAVTPEKIAPLKKPLGLQ